MEYTTVEYDANKAYKSGINYILAADRNDIYLKMRSVGSTSSVPSVVFGTVENNTEWLYALYEKSKVAVGSREPIMKASCGMILALVQMLCPIRCTRLL